VGAEYRTITARLDAMDRAMALFQDNITRVPTDTDKQIKQLRDLVYETFKVVNERFSSIDLRFTERDTRFNEVAKLNGTAVDAAFHAAREAVTKSEGSVAKQVDQLNVLLSRSSEAVESKISDIKDRITAMENRSIGQVENRNTGRSDQLQWVGLIALLISVLGFIFMVTKGP